MPAGSLPDLLLRLLIARLRPAHLNGLHNEFGMKPLRPVFQAGEESIRRAVLIAAIERTLTLALLTRQNIVADENFAADSDALRVRLAPARVELLLGVHFTSPLCVKK